ncbi:MAG: rhodanese-like domain-containing protein, partial [Acidimicrobiia bacterium]|nr:rhodanese-like domain-containing protein [Acidimicrobiia bacterium]
PGSIGIEYGDSFAPWAGWLLPYDAPIMLVLGDDQDPNWGATELGRIGFERVLGAVRGVDAWGSEGFELASYRTATVGELLDARAGDPGLQILDVRDPKEWEAGHIDGSTHTYLPDLAEFAAFDRSRPVWVICRTGNRASIAAGILESLGYKPIVISSGGVPEALAQLA